MKFTHAIALWAPLSACLFAGQALTQSNIIGGHVYGDAKAGAAPTYTGPGDVVSGASIWVGLRGYNAAYSTGSNNAITIRRASDSTTSNIKILSTGALDVASASTFCASTTCFITTFFDQTGNGQTISQATAGNQPQLLFSCFSTSLPCGSFLSAKFMAGTLSGSISQPYTYAAVGYVATGVTPGWIFARNAAWAFGGAGGGANTVSMYAGITTQNVFGASTTALNAYVGVGNGASTVLGFNNTTGSPGNPGTAALSSAFGFGADNSPSTPWNGYLNEAGIWPSGFTSTQITNMCHNQFAYWTTAVSC